MNSGTPIHDMFNGANTAAAGMSRTRLPAPSSGTSRRVSLLAMLLSR